MLRILRTSNEEPIPVPLNDAVVAALRLVHDRGGRKGRVFQRPRQVNRLKRAPLVRRWTSAMVVSRQFPCELLRSTEFRGVAQW